MLDHVDCCMCIHNLIGQVYFGDYPCDYILCEYLKYIVGIMDFSAPET